MSSPVAKVISRSGLSLEKEFFFKKGGETVGLHAAKAAAGPPNLLILVLRPLEDPLPPPLSQSQSRGSDRHCESAICPLTRLHSALGQEIRQHSRLNMKYRAEIVVLLHV